MRKTNTIQRVFFCACGEGLGCNNPDDCVPRTWCKCLQAHLEVPLLVKRLRDHQDSLHGPLQAPVIAAEPVHAPTDIHHQSDALRVEILGARLWDRGRWTWHGDARTVFSTLFTFHTLSVLIFIVGCVILWQHWIPVGHNLPTKPLCFVFLASAD